jgi:hypothetical protein
MVGYDCNHDVRVVGALVRESGVPWGLCLALFLMFKVDEYMLTSLC